MIAHVSHNVHSRSTSLRLVSASHFEDDNVVSATAPALQIPTNRRERRPFRGDCSQSRSRSQGQKSAFGRCILIPKIASLPLPKMPLSPRRTNTQLRGGARGKDIAGDAIPGISAPNTFADTKISSRASAPREREISWKI